MPLPPPPQHSPSTSASLCEMIDLFSSRCRWWLDSGSIWEGDVRWRGGLFVGDWRRWVGGVEWDWVVPFPLLPSFVYASSHLPPFFSHPLPPPHWSIQTPSHLPTHPPGPPLPLNPHHWHVILRIILSPTILHLIPLFSLLLPEALSSHSNFGWDQLPSNQPSPKSQSTTTNKGKWTCFKFLWWFLNDYFIYFYWIIE